MPRLKSIATVCLCMAWAGSLSAADPVLKPGDRAPEFHAVEYHTAREVKLDDLAGNYVYIDFWATWCAPCIQEMPYLLELEKQLEGKNIVFVGFSWEVNRGKWGQLIESRQMAGIQLNSAGNKTFPDAFGVDAIPHFVILDPAGRVVDPDAGRPSDPQTLLTLLDLLDI